MTPQPSKPVVPLRPDRRDAGPLLGDERAVLDYFLEFYRESLLLKIAGLDAAALCLPAAPPSKLTLLGVVRHLRVVESYWVREVLLGESIELPYRSVADPAGDFTVDPETAAADVADYLATVAELRVLLADWADLGSASVGRRKGEQVNLRWILVHLIEEYARHLGHLDLIRERIDGQTG